MGWGCRVGPWVGWVGFPSPRRPVRMGPPRRRPTAAPPAALRVRLLPAADVREGAAVTLLCDDATPAPGTAYGWLKDGRWLREGPSAAMLLPAALSAHAGAYSCTARLGERRRRADPAELTVLCECAGRGGGGGGGGGGPRRAGSCGSAAPRPSGGMFE